MHLEKLGGKVSYCRLRGSEVQSLGNRAFAVKNLSALPAGVTSRGFIFSGVGAGLYPLAVVGGSLDEVLDAMAKSDIEIYVDGGHGLHDAAFTIFAKVVRNFTQLPPHRMYDADKRVIKGVGSFFGDVVGSATAAFSGIGSLLPDMNVGTFVDWTKGVDAHANSKDIKDFLGGGGKSTGKAGVVISMYDGPGSIGTRRKSIKMAALASIISAT